MHKTPQEDFWAGSFGDEYSTRNKDERIVACNTSLFSKILSRTDKVASVIEYGPNIGLNLIAIRRLLPKAEISGVEINANACEVLNQLGFVHTHCQSILDFKPDRVWDFVFTKGVLIHINPDELGKVYDLLYISSGKYICVCEYYNPTPTEVKYRGLDGRLFKRDFASEIMERHHDLNLVDYGFVYHGDSQFPQDDLSWFLMEKRG